MSEAKIRPYRPTDHGAARSLWVELTEQHRELYDDPGFGGPDPGAAFDEHLTRLDLSGLWVAEDADELVIGLVGLVLKGRAGEVEPIVVTRSHRGQGVGRALLAHVAERARERGLGYLTISPTSRNEAALRSFHAAGYGVLSAVQLTLDLGKRGHQWQDGLGLRELNFRY
jgi:GNAT superfamily N-acetyltransferase